MCRRPKAPKTPKPPAPPAPPPAQTATQVQGAPEPKDEGKLRSDKNRRNKLRIDKKGGGFADGSSGINVAVG